MAAELVHHEKEVERIDGNAEISDAMGKDKKRDFDLELVLHHFNKCLTDDNILLLEEYLKAYSELCRFFKLMGPLFGFVAKDIGSKIRAIEYHIQTKNGNNYNSIQSMVSFEISEGTASRKSPHPSGSRTLLRLHHALEFILAFMERITKSDDNAKTSKIAWQVYSETLSKHHPWTTKILASVAVYALPSKQQLIEIMCKHDYVRVKDLLPAVFDAGQGVYNTTQSVLESHDLLHIL